MSEKLIGYAVIPVYEETDNSVSVYPTDVVDRYILYSNDSMSYMGPSNPSVPLTEMNEWFKTEFVVDYNPLEQSDKKEDYNTYLIKLCNNVDDVLKLRSGGLL